MVVLCRLGNLDSQGQQSDLTFIVQQQLHPAFRRLADDLYAIVNVPLVTGRCRVQLVAVICVTLITLSTSQHSTAGAQ